MTAFARVRDVDVRIVRIFNTYGPRLRPGDGRVVPSFCVQALGGRPLTIQGDGSQTRSFCYVDDQVDGILALLESDWRGPMNIGNAEECTVLNLASLVLRLTGSSSRLAFAPLPRDDPSRRCPDLGLAERVLGWRPRVSLAEGVARTIAWFEGREVDTTARTRATSRQPGVAGGRW